MIDSNVGTETTYDERVSFRDHMLATLPPSNLPSTAIHSTYETEAQRNSCELIL